MRKDRKRNKDLQKDMKKEGQRHCVEEGEEKLSMSNIIQESKKR